jgi:hypothetical protein
MQDLGRLRMWLAVLLLALMAGGCATNSGRRDGNDRGNFSVPLEKASVHAAVAKLEAAVMSARPLAEQEGAFEEWLRASLGKPLTLHDVNTKPLFYVFPVIREGDVVGKIWVSANELVGAAVPVIETGSRSGWLDVEDMQAAFTRLEELAAEKYKDWEIVWLDVVVYTYPKIGAMAVVRNPKTQDERKLVVDVGNLEMITDPKDVLPDPEEGPIFGVGPWLSFLDEIPDDSFERRIVSWADDNEWANQMTSELQGAGIDLSNLGQVPLSEDQWRIAKDVLFNLTTCDMWVANRGLPAPGGVDQFCQQESYYCSVATASMIAAYYGVGHSQTYIAKVTKSGATTGTDPKEMRKYYRDTQKGMGMKNSEAYTPDWIKVKQDIKKDRPVHTCTVPSNGTVGHCRAAFGIKECQKKVGTKVIATKILGVVDPWPNTWGPSKGCGEKWEDFDAMNKWNANPHYTLFYHVWP